MKEEMKMIAAEKLHPNPDNPRRNLGGLTELADSIRAKGVLQNLAVVPLEDKPGEYTIIMGHRRHAAAVQAGLKELPCRVMEKLERSDQVAAMLAENLHRSNLTPYEEGQGFQLMLDLGETEATICEKTGFGKTTVRHRVNISKLDQEKLKVRQDDPSFQLSLTDLVALEKVPDISRRNEILEKAEDSRDLAYKAQCAANEIKREANLARAIPILEKAGVKPLPEKAQTEIYNSSKWQTVETIDLEADLPESYQPKQAGELYHYKDYREIRILRRAEKQKAAQKPKTEAEKKKQEQENLQKKNRKLLLEAAKEADALRRDFILGIISGKIPRIKGDELAKAQEALWRVLYDNCACVSRTGCIAFRGGKDDIYSMSVEEREEAGKWADKLGMVDQMLITASNACSCKGLVDSNGEYNTRAAEKVKKLYMALRFFGLRMDKDTKLILDGRHELYYVKPTLVEKPVVIEDKAAKDKEKAKTGSRTATKSGTKGETARKTDGTKAEPVKGPKAKASVAKTETAKEPTAQTLVAKTEPPKEAAAQAPVSKAGSAKEPVAKTPAVKAEPARKPTAKIPAAKTGPAKDSSAKAPDVKAESNKEPAAKTEPAEEPVARTMPAAEMAHGSGPKPEPATPAGASPDAGPGKDGLQPASATGTQAA